MDDLSRILALYESGHVAEAATLCADLALREPGNAAVWAMRGAIALKQSLFADAADYLQRAGAIVPGDHELWANLGMALHGAGRIEEALRAFKNALKRNPQSAICFVYLGRCHLAAGRPEAAASALNAALRLRPEWPEALNAFALFSLAVDRPDKALTFVRRALAVEPGHIDSLRLGGTASDRINDQESAAEYFRQATALQPNAEVLMQLALSLQRLGRHDEALPIFDRGLELDPQNPSLQHGCGMSLLALERLHEGWPLYAARFNMDMNVESLRATAAGMLLEPPRAGMRVVAWADQGIGEQVLFVNLIPDLLRTGAEIALECDYRLVPLFARSFPEITVCAHTFPAQTALASYADGRFCLSDAAAWFRDDMESFPKHGGYLRADPSLTAEIRNRYRSGRHDRPLVGISWRRADGSLISDAKTLPLEQWGPILHVAGVTFVNLQYGDRAAELADVAKKFGVRIISDASVDPLIDLDAFAAQVAAMDLVISTSSATAHMAGALNIPTWTFLPAGSGSLWHWFRGRADSPWYPSMTLFRQPHQGDWDPVLNSASGALVDFVDAWHMTAAKGADSK